MKKTNIFSKKSEKPMQEEKDKRKFKSRINIEGLEQLSEDDLEKVAGGARACCVTAI